MKPFVITLAAFALGVSSPAIAADLRLGIVGTDTSHVTAFTGLLNNAAAPNHIPGARVVAAFRGGSPDFAQSRDRIDGFTREIREKYGVEIVDTIAELCQRVDAVMLLSVDGRVHLAQAREIIAARKPLFIDKPLAATLEDAREIARLAKQAGVPWFSSSSQRYGVTALKASAVYGAEVWGPGPFVEHHPLDLAWYGIHEAEMLFALMGTGCEEVTRVATADTDVVVCRWKDGRIGTMRALRPYSTYGAAVFRKDAKGQTVEVGATDATYVPLVREIVKFFETRVVPVANDETLEIFAFLDAAQRSKEAGGKPTRLRQ
jgi:Oxidoreductase family, NAD-binding Rossmann fold